MKPTTEPISVFVEKINRKPPFAEFANGGFTFIMSIFLAIFKKCNYNIMVCKKLKHMI